MRESEIGGRVALLVSLVAIALIAAMFAPNVGGAAGSSERRTTAHAHVIDAALSDLAGGAATILEARLRAGRERRVLVAEASISVGDLNRFVDMAFGVTVNGFPMLGGIRQTCGALGGSRCQATGIFWLDLEAAEAASPGTFVTQPLLITLWGRAINNPAFVVFGDATLTVRMDRP